jgi:hypothetical protein
LGITMRNTKEHHDSNEKGDLDEYNR